MKTTHICGGDERPGPRDACPNVLHDHPLPSGDIDSQEVAARRLRQQWSNPRCPDCGLHGWVPPAVGALTDSDDVTAVAKALHKQLGLPTPTAEYVSGMAVRALDTARRARGQATGDPVAVLREHLPDVLIEHTRRDIGHCHCGWGAAAGNLGQSHAVHVTVEAVARVLAVLGGEGR